MLSFDSIPWQMGVVNRGDSHLTEALQGQQMWFTNYEAGLATQPSPVPYSRVRVTLRELMMKLHTAKVICLKLLRKLDKALQNDILRGF